MRKHRVLIVEDHTILREGLRALLSSETALEIVGEARDGYEAVKHANLLSPDLVLMDLTMPNKNGTEAIAAIVQRNRKTKIIALTVHKTEEYVRAALDAGVSGYVLKDDSSAELLSAIHSVLNGKTYLSPSICSKIVMGYLEHSPESNLLNPWDVLTVREREIIKLIAEGKKNKTIAEQLSISLKTVEKHRTNLMNKLDLHSASALTAYAFGHDLIERS